MTYCKTGISPILPLRGTLPGGEGSFPQSAEPTAPSSEGAGPRGERFLEGRRYFGSLCSLRMTGWGLILGVGWARMGAEGA